MPRLLPLLILLISAGFASAHRINFVSVKADFKTDGTYTVLLSVEPALIPVDQSLPFPPTPPESEVPEDAAERQAIYDLAKPFFESSFTFFFDDQQITPQFTFAFVSEEEKNVVAEGVSFRDGKRHLFLTATFSGNTPANAEKFHFKISPELSQAVEYTNRVDGEISGHVQPLFPGEPSYPFKLSNTRPAGDSPPQTESADDPPPQGSFFRRAYNYLALGFRHIIPDGLDHIFFVLALFFLSQKLGPLLWQVTAFTVAHTITLALAYFDVVRVSSDTVEPLIAFSIAVVALENIFSNRLHRHRVVTVFTFGLLHGLGFAGAFSELELPKETFIQALIFLNIGVEVGQLAVIAILVAHLYLGLALFKKYIAPSGDLEPSGDLAPSAYRAFVAVPASMFIATVAIVATIDRIWPDAIPQKLSFLQIL